MFNKTRTGNNAETDFISLKDACHLPKPWAGVGWKGLRVGDKNVIGSVANVADGAALRHLQKVEFD